jgi:hypothetical protein
MGTHFRQHRMAHLDLSGTVPHRVQVFAVIMVLLPTRRDLLRCLGGIAEPVWRRLLRNGAFFGLRGVQRIGNR